MWDENFHKFSARTTAKCSALWVHAVVNVNGMWFRIWFLALSWFRPGGFVVVDENIIKQVHAVALLLIYDIVRLKRMGNEWEWERGVWKIEKKRENIASKRPAVLEWNFQFNSYTTTHIFSLTWRMPTCRRVGANDDDSHKSSHCCEGGTHLLFPWSDDNVTFSNHSSHFFLFRVVVRKKNHNNFDTFFTDLLSSTSLR